MASAAHRSGDPAARESREPFAIRTLAATGFLLLAVAVCLRPLFRETWTVAVPGLLVPPASWWDSNPTVMHLAHLLAAAGLAASALWVSLGRRRWRFSGLEVAAGILVLAALLSVPQASDRRMAVNAAIGSILPILAAAMLHQLLVGRRAWQRALLASLLAMAAANAAASTAQHLWQDEQALRDYQANKDAMWASVGRDADDPLAQIHEARLRARQPVGFFFHPNVMASFLLLGLAATAAAAAGAWPARRAATETAARAGPDATGSVPGATGHMAHMGHMGRMGPMNSRRAHVSNCGSRWSWSAGLLAWLPGVALLATAAWFVLVMCWVGSAGSIAGLLAAAATAIAAVLMRTRPRGLAVLLAAALALLQVALVVLALNAPRLYHSLAAGGGKTKSLAVRLNYWEGALRIFRQHPLSGVGPAQFGKHYTAIKPPYASEDLSHPHDWLLAQAAEWGAVGAIGLVLALALPGWRIVRSLAQGSAHEDVPDAAGRMPAGAAAAVSPGHPATLSPCHPSAGAAPTTISLSALVLLACWSFVAAGGWDAGLTCAAAVSLAAAILAGLSARWPRMAPAILLAGLVGFLVHAMVEMTSTVSAATWPFWSMLAVALAWTAPDADGGLPAVTQHSALSTQHLLRPALLLPIAATLAVVVLCRPPLVSAHLLDQAQQAIRGRQPDRAVTLLRGAAAADPLDAVPLKAAALLRQRTARQVPARASDYQADAVAMFRAAVQRDPSSYMTWRNLALADMHLAVQTDDFATVADAVAAMRKALALYPNWPAGWLELAGMAAAESATHPDRPDLLRIALDALDRAEALDDLWPAEDARKFRPADRTRIQQMRRDVTRRLGSAASRPGG